MCYSDTDRQPPPRVSLLPGLQLAQSAGAGDLLRRLVSEQRLGVPEHPPLVIHQAMGGFNTCSFTFNDIHSLLYSMNLFVQLEFICLLHFPHSEHPCCHGTEGYHKIHFTIPNSNLSVIQFPIIFHSIFMLETLACN